jgi:hypothetical protein
MKTVWRKSSHSGTEGGPACVELARVGGVVGVRDSKDPDGSQLLIMREALKAALAVHR